MLYEHVNIPLGSYRSLQNFLDALTNGAMTMTDRIHVKSVTFLPRYWGITDREANEYIAGLEARQRTRGHPSLAALSQAAYNIKLRHVLVDEYFSTAVVAQPCETMRARPLQAYEPPSLSSQMVASDGRGR